MSDVAAHGQHQNTARSPRRPNSCLTCRAFPETVWEALPLEDALALDAAKVTHHFRPGETVLSHNAPGDGLWCLGAGVVCVRRANRAGSLVPTHLRHPGAVFGLSAFITGAASDVTVEAIRTSRICLVPAAAVRSLLSRNLNLALAMIRSLVDELSALEQRLVALRPLAPMARLSAVLMELANEIGVWLPKGSCVIRPALPVPDLASIIGVSPEVAIDSLAELAGSGVLAVTGRHMEIIDPDRLRAIAAG